MQYQKIIHVLGIIGYLAYLFKVMIQFIQINIRKQL
jgi:hypothetical protein